MTRKVCPPNKRCKNIQMCDRRFQIPSTDLDSYECNAWRPTHPEMLKLSSIYKSYSRLKIKSHTLVCQDKSSENSQVLPTYSQTVKVNLWISRKIYWKQLFISYFRYFVNVQWFFSRSLVHNDLNENRDIRSGDLPGRWRLRETRCNFTLILYLFDKFGRISWFKVLNIWK